MSTTAPPAGMTFDERYRVIESRDTRFDGQFVTAVRSTGIYCRPSCPARTPEAGERHLLRDERRRARGRLPRVQALPARGRARVAGVEPPRRHDRPRDAPHRRRRRRARGRSRTRPPPRLLAAAPHPAAHRRARRRPARAQPRAPRAHRPHAARRHRPAGRRCRVLGRLRERAAVQRHRARGVRDAAARAARPPHAPPGARAEAPPGAIDLVLPHRGPLDAAGLFAWMARPRDPGRGGRDADTSFARTLRLAGGPAWFELRLDEVGRVRLRARLAAPQRPARDGDPRAAAVRPRRRSDRRRRRAGAASRTRSARRAPCPASACPAPPTRTRCSIRAMIGQQITVAAARTALTRAHRGARRAGRRLRRHRRCSSRRWRRSPSTAHEVLRGPAARIRALVGAAAALADGTLTLDAGRRRRRAARGAARHAGDRPLDRRLRAHARDRRPRRVPAGRRRRARGRRGQPASRPIRRR